jgi:hypothetical protein
MTDTNSRDLIRRLVDEFEGWIVHAEIEDIERAHELIDEALAYLAQSEPVEPSDDELLFAFYEASLAEGGDTDEVTLRGLRAVLARWGK